MANKVKYGLSNVYYAAISSTDTTGAVTYSTPVRIPGAVNLSLEAQGENEPFYADNIKYYISSNNSGYAGDLEVALIPDSFRKDILGEVLDSNGVYLEDVDAQATPFALLFQFEGDEKGTRHVIYNCTATRPSVEGATKEDSTEVQTETLSLECASIFNTSVNKNLVKARCLNSTATSTTYEAWFSSVYQTT